jgi:MoxR-like ATPase
MKMDELSGVRRKPRNNDQKIAVARKDKKKSSYLVALDVFGFDKIEPAILASLVTEDPLLLIGRSGTGKTFLLNSLSEELGLEHRHYNASLISFDDVVGFPFPDADNDGVKFLETPATVWNAESVLVDEISRCKPEHQNRLFSLVHERKVQGISIPKLRYRWAAMNPGTVDQGGLEEYTGSEPLDPALADRFSLIVWAVDWVDLTDEERRKVANPSGEGKISDDAGKLKKQLGIWRNAFIERLKNCPSFIIEYVTAVISALNGAGVRISPRRSRLMARSLLAATIVEGEKTQRLYKLILQCSLPHVAWGEEIGTEIIAAAHRAAWDTASESEGVWIHAFMAEPSLPGKLGILLSQCHNSDEGTQAIAQFIASEPKEKAAALAFVIYPATVMEKLPIGAEGINDLGKVAVPILSVEGEISWQERTATGGTKHPEFSRFTRVISKTRGARRERAKQFFNWCLVEQVSPEDPAALEEEIESCVKLLKKKKLV